MGKSTLLLQVADALANVEKKVLYVCGEESAEQTKRRALRLKLAHPALLILNESHLEQILYHTEKVQPDLIIIDSIQIVYKEEVHSTPGSVAQVRECGTELMYMAKETGIAVFLIGHVTKSGEIAGPKILEHLVDTVLYFEGDKLHNYRMLRAVKNRFGPTDEIALFSMQLEGLQEVDNLSKAFLEQRKQNIPGSTILSTIEGSRPILVEVQALVTKTAFSTPSRRSMGFDSHRLPLLLAVMEKPCISNCISVISLSPLWEEAELSNLRQIWLFFSPLPPPGAIAL